jgi:hypothetical protein
VPRSGPAAGFAALGLRGYDAVTAAGCCTARAQLRRHLHQAETDGGGEDEEFTAEIAENAEDKE